MYTSHCFYRAAARHGARGPCVTWWAVNLSQRTLPLLIFCRNAPNVHSCSKLPNPDHWHGAELSVTIEGSWSSYRAKVLKYLRQIAVITPYAQVRGRDNRLLVTPGGCPAVVTAKPSRLRTAAECVLGLYMEEAAAAWRYDST
eukprot:GHUV01027375.1.p2 GENE.GHUV01027375.1~~GHUV01027375.1.p2  ORF type:complete len:143 (-),score=28.39 GHUV01027375.1:1728-2156(-)